MTTLKLNDDQARMIKNLLENAMDDCTEQSMTNPRREGYKLNEIRDMLKCPVPYVKILNW